MKIETKNNNTYDDIALDSIESAWSEFNNAKSFSNYNFVNNTLLIAKFNPSINGCCLYSKISTLNEIVNMGKKFYNILKSDIISNYTDILTTPKDCPEFVDLNNQNKFVYDTFINKFITNKDLEKHFEEFSEIVLHYCKDNGLPLIDDMSTFYNEDNPNETIYACEIKPFISLSIIIYIINSIQMNLRDLFSLGIASKEIGTISQMFPKDKYDYADAYIKEALNVLYSFQWFLKLDYDDIYKINLRKIICRLTEKINYIDNSTSYLKVSEKVLFSETNKKFFIIDCHNNIMSIAWQKLKTSMFSYYGYITKKCKKCGKLFDTENNSDAYCSAECKRYSPNINSAKSYEKLNSLHLQLKILFKKCDKDKFNRIDQKLQEDIIKYSNLKITELKKMNDKNKIKNLEKFIIILSN